MKKIYNVVTALSVLGYQSEAFYRVQEYKKEIAIVPVSAKTGIGIPETICRFSWVNATISKREIKPRRKIQSRNNTRS